MRRKVWLEAALNGRFFDDRGSLFPNSVDRIVSEGLQCAAAGAAIIHFHPYNGTNIQSDEYPVYKAILERLRAGTDAILYGTLTHIGTKYAPSAEDVAMRFEPIRRIAMEGLVDWIVCDPASVNLTEKRSIARNETGRVYLNPDSHFREGLKIAQAHSVNPSVAVFEPGFLRMAGAWINRVSGIPPAVYRFMFSDDYAFGFPPKEYALRAYLELLRDEVGEVPWMAAGLGHDVTGLIPHVVECGGGVRVGLEDAPLAASLRNIEWVEKAREIIERQGFEVATPDDVRRSMVAPGAVDIGG